MHTLPYAVNCSLLFSELPLLERPAAARSAGFEAVEFWWPFADAVPRDSQVDAFVDAVSDAGVHLVGLNFFAGDMAGGDRGIVSWPGRRSEFRENVSLVMSLGERLGCALFNALYGNRIDDHSADLQDDLAVENLLFAAEAAACIGGKVLVEPLSGAERYPLLSAADALVVVNRVGAAAGYESIGLLADLYHLAVNGEDLSKLIAEHTHHIAHVQIADSPGRNEPGTGNLPLMSRLADLQSHGYAGWVGLEYQPATTTEAGFAWLQRAGDHPPASATHPTPQEES